MEYIIINGTRYAVNHGQIEVMTESGKRSVRIEGWVKVESRELVAGQRLDRYKLVTA